MTPNAPTRRLTLQWMAALGSAGPLALNLTAVGKAAAQSGGAASPYKALVCIFLQGGNDSNNLLVATDPGSFAQYTNARSGGFDPIALMAPGTAPTPLGQVSPVTHRTVANTSAPEHWGGLLPITPKTAQAIPAANQTDNADQTRTFAVHPLMPLTQGLFNSGALAFIANVGTLLAPLTKAAYEAPTPATLIPARLFSHADQQSAWQSGQVEGSQTGWGGLIGDTFAAVNAKGLDFTGITTAGNTVFLDGVQTTPFRVNFGKDRATAQTVNLLSYSGTYDGSPTVLAELRAGIQDASLGPSTSNDLMVDYAAAMTRSLTTSVVYDSALSAPNGAYTKVAAPNAFTNPITGKPADNPLADQLQAVAETAAAQSLLGVGRQIFFVQYGSFDTHQSENSRQGLLLAELDHGLSYFQTVLQQLGLADQVTTFTASDFNRTYTTNGDGTDHAWGGHHLVVGGAVKGGDIYGAYPTAGIDRPASAAAPAFVNPDAAGNAFIPTTSVDQYLATMAKWMGVSDEQLSGIFPRLASFTKSDLGFMTA